MRQIIDSEIVYFIENMISISEWVSKIHPRNEGKFCICKKMLLKNEFMLLYFDKFLNQLILKNKIKHVNGYSTTIHKISFDTILYYPILNGIYMKILWKNKIMLAYFDKFLSQFLHKSEMEHINGHSTCNLMLLLSHSDIHFAIVDKYAKFLKIFILYYPILSLLYHDNTELTIKYILKLLSDI